MLKKREFRKIVLGALILVLTSSMSVPVFAVTRYDTKMTKGGKWTYSRLDTNVTKDYSSSTLRSLAIVKEVEYLSPETVKQMQYALSNGVSKDMMNSALKKGAETAASSGITAAKNALIAKYGASLATKLIPILAAASWSYTAYDVFSAIYEGQELNRLTKAAQKGTGLILKHSNGSFAWYYWDGSSDLGNYPYACVGPNTYQMGRVSTN